MSRIIVVGVVGVTVTEEKVFAQTVHRVATVVVVAFVWFTSFRGCDGLSALFALLGFEFLLFLVVGWCVEGRFGLMRRRALSSAPGSRWALSPALHRGARKAFECTDHRTKLARNDVDVMTVVLLCRLSCEW